MKKRQRNNTKTKKRGRREHYRLTPDEWDAPSATMPRRTRKRTMTTSERQRRAYNAARHAAGKQGMSRERWERDGPPRDFD